MEEFNKIIWTRENPNDDPTTFIGNQDILNDEDVETSYIYQFLCKTLDLSKAKFIQPPPSPEIISIPGQKYTLNETLISTFTHDQQRSLLRGLKYILLNKTKLEFYEKKDVENYNSFKQQIAIENVRFLKRAKLAWTLKEGNRALNCKTSLLSYATYEWQEKIKRVFDYPLLYKKVELLSFSYLEDECPIQMIQTQNLLEVGTVAKFIPHSLASVCVLKTNTLPSIDNKLKYYSKLSVSKDKNIDNMVENVNIDIVISLSALKKLVNFTDINNTWTIPVVAKVIKLKQSNGSIIEKTVIYIDKPLAKLNPTANDHKGRIGKVLVKTNFCSQEGFTHPNHEINHDELNVEQKQIKNDVTEKDTDDKSETNESTNRQIHHNASYKLWKLGQIDEKNEFVKIPGSNRTINVLVRTKIDACEVVDVGKLQSTTVVPKLEYQLCFGANVYTKSELSHFWTTLFFKPFSTLYRIRMHHYTSEVVMIEPCNMHRVNSEASSIYNYKPALGLGVLYKILYNLKDLGKGNYLLQHEPKHGPFVVLMQETDVAKDNFNLHELYINKSALEKKLKSWTPIDPNVILPKHIHMGQMPGMFKPRVLKGFKIKRKMAKKKKKKMKMNIKREIKIENNVKIT